MKEEGRIDHTFSLIRCIGENSFHKFSVCLFHNSPERDSWREWEERSRVIMLMELHELEEIIEFIGVDCIECEFVFNRILNHSIVEPGVSAENLMFNLVLYSVFSLD